MHPRQPGPIANPGGRLHARRAFAAMIVALLVVWRPSLPVAAAGTPDGDPQVTVRGEYGVYTVAARFTVPHPADATLAVLSDFERIPEFMPDVRTSRVLDRAKGRLLVEQEAEARVMLFSKRVHLVLEVRRSPDALHFRDVCGRSFVRYEGAWRIAEEDGRSQVSYELAAQPAFDVPGFLLKRLLRRDAREMIERLRAEIASRAADAPPGADEDRSPAPAGGRTEGSKL